MPRPGCPRIWSAATDRAGRGRSLTAGWREEGRISEPRSPPRGRICREISPMIEPFEDDHAYLTELPEDLRLKRAAAARRRRWRRRLALGALLAAGGAVVALAVTSLGGGSKTAHRETRQA